MEPLGYKPSRYNVAVENDRTGELILFNTLYGSTAVIDRNRRAAVASLLGQSPLPSARGDESRGLIEQLAELKFIVDDQLDELAVVRRRKDAGIADRNRLDVILMPNLDCNFACPYCYEKHDRRNRMSEETERRLIRWLERTIPAYKVVLLSWFGGEPLLSPKTVIAVSNRVRDICQSQGVRLLTHVTTNGYCLTPPLARRLLGAGLDRYQITVDGPEDTHDRTRVLKSGKGSFRRIHQNIVALARANSGVRVSLRVNFNHRNLHAIPAMLELFPHDIRHQLRIVFEPIFGDAELSATTNLEGEQISESVARYYDSARALGYDVRLGSIGVGKLVYCYAEREHQYIVDFKGDIFKCSVSEFGKSQRMASIGDACIIRDEPNWSRWMGMSGFDQKCEECTFLPLCMGGCRKDRIEHGQTGSYCSLVPTNTSHSLKFLAYGSFAEVVRASIGKSRRCASGAQSEMDCGCQGTGMEN